MARKIGIWDHLSSEGLRAYKFADKKLDLVEEYCKTHYEGIYPPAKKRLDNTFSKVKRTGHKMRFDDSDIILSTSVTLIASELLAASVVYGGEVYLEHSLAVPIIFGAGGVVLGYALGVGSKASAEGLDNVINALGAVKSYIVKKRY